MKNSFSALIVLLVFLIYTPSTQSKTKMPDEVRTACEKYGEMYNICPEFLEGIAYEESRFEAAAVDSTKTCHGLMQIHKASHKSRMKRLGVSNIYDVDGNILVAADYLAELFEQYEDAGTVLMIYHGEKDAVRKSEQGDLSKYAKRVLSMSEMYEIAHGKK